MSLSALAVMAYHRGRMPLRPASGLWTWPIRCMIAVSVPYETVPRRMPYAQ